MSEKIKEVGSSSPNSPNVSAYPSVLSPSQEKWAIATYLRIKPFDGAASDQIIYGIEGKNSHCSEILLPLFDPLSP